MDILFLNWKDLKNPDVGGAEIIIYEMAKRLVAEGHTVTWFCRSFPNAKEYDHYDGIQIIRRGNILSVYWEAFTYYRSLSRKPDRVVDCINTICWQTPLYVPKSARVMLVNQLAKEVFLYELLFPLSYMAYALEWLEYLSYKSTRILCYAASTKKDLESFGLPSKNISIFPLGLDHHRYISGAKSKDPLFVFVARMARMKRPDLCVESMSIVTKMYPKSRLAIIGYGPMEKYISKRITQLHLERNVELVNKNALFFTKNIKDKKVWFMQQAWALLLPSVKEGWGMVVTEAASCGTPSIVTDVTGLRDSVKPNMTGLHISSSPTKEELASAMIRIIEDESLREKFSINAQKNATQFTWEKSYKKFAQLLKA
jgi:glycosyltransferase involved in cell wall biosynthesis